MTSCTRIHRSFWSKIAVGSGGLWGKGWTHGTQSQLEFLPERHTDFVLAAVAVFSEEFGWVGAALMPVYVFVIGRALWLAANARDTYGRLLGGAIALTFFVYILVNSAMITGLMPVKGAPLPLISYGGTSVVSLLFAFGILFSIHAHRRWRILMGGSAPIRLQISVSARGNGSRTVKLCVAIHLYDDNLALRQSERTLP